jgi:divalent metal cation (Fe/Co/Zn/Cd) transporter
VHGVGLLVRGASKSYPSCNHRLTVAKALLFVYCTWIKGDNDTVGALAQDHRNDLLINSFGLTMGILANHFAWWLDSAGALVVAMFILRSWISTAYGKV